MKGRQKQSGIKLSRAIKMTEISQSSGVSCTVDLGQQAVARNTPEHVIKHCTKMIVCCVFVNDAALFF